MSTVLSIQKKQTGSSLIEVLIALLVFTIGIQGVTALQFQSVKDSFDSSQRSRGIWAAQELINRIRANPEARADEDYELDANPCDLGIPATYCSERTANAAADCTTTQMATFDIWEAMCLNPNLAQNQSPFLNLNLEIVCADTPCRTNSEYSLVMEWQSKSVTDDSANITDADNSLKTQKFEQVFVP